MEEGFHEKILHLHEGSESWRSFVVIGDDSKFPFSAEFRGLPVAVIGKKVIIDAEHEKGAVNFYIAGSSPAALNEIDLQPRRDRIRE